MIAISVINHNAMLTGFEYLSLQCSAKCLPAIKLTKMHAIKYKIYFNIEKLHKRFIIYYIYYILYIYIFITCHYTKSSSKELKNKTNYSRPKKNPQ